MHHQARDQCCDVVDAKLLFLPAVKNENWISFRNGSFVSFFLSPSVMQEQHVL